MCPDEAVVASFFCPVPPISIAPDPAVEIVATSAFADPLALRLVAVKVGESLCCDEVHHIFWDLETAVHMEMGGLASSLTWRPAQVQELCPPSTAFCGIQAFLNCIGPQLLSPQGNILAIVNVKGAIDCIADHLEQIQAGCRAPVEDPPGGG